MPQGLAREGHPPADGRAHDAANGLDSHATSFVAGGGLAILALLQRGSAPRLLTAVASGALIYRGIRGEWPFADAIRPGAKRSHRARGVRAGHGCRVETALTIQRSPADLYKQWRALERLPNLFDHLVSVEDLGDGRSRWTARGPLGSSVSWDAEIINERENELLAWRSIPGSTIDTAGSVHFEPTSHDRGTVVRVSLKYDPPAGKVGAIVANLLDGGLDSQLREDLRRFKQLMEAGETPTIEGQPRGRCGHRD